MSTIEPPPPPPASSIPPPHTPPPAGPLGGAHASLIARVKNILLSPKTEWERINAEPASVQSLYLGYACILAAIPAVAQLIGSVAFGQPMPTLGGIVMVRASPANALVSALVTYVLALVQVGVLALIIEFLAPTFGGVKDRVQAFKVAIYASTASWLAGVFLIVPMLSILAILGLYSLYLLYLGLPRLMRTPQEKTLPYLGLIIVAAIVLFFIVGTVASAARGLGGAGVAAPVAYAPGQVVQPPAYVPPVQQPQQPVYQQPQPPTAYAPGFDPAAPAAAPATGGGK